MTATLHLEADLRLQVDTGVADDDPGRRLSASLTGSGTTLTLTLDGLGEVPLGMSYRRAADTVRDLARLLAEDGLTVVVATGSGPLVSLGRVRQRVGDRVLTGSSYVAVHDRRGALRMLRGRRDDGAPALAGLVPPTTPWPLTPTFTPPRRRHVTTTHDPLGGGDPRLVYYLVPPEQGGERQVLHLRRGVTTVGGAAEDDLTVPGLQPGHVRVERDASTDEYEVVPVPGALTLVGGRPVEEPVRLRTGLVVRAGELSLAYVRDEYADHGRPYGGRQGGEFSRQRPQPRPRYW
ncbi:hypothetical protein [Ornithinimicrobium pekingense]|uniref:FHA domain-containing protein n=1 Tax=Ornithinimicrobium pekingense TaxID=384677 RepID=A0ABQ2F4E9_9MICO|nr:hypothetical protein [Ornithinimicrobium pekingense]GGK60259.1 hypothetical protein GCM10011509_05700 [Ornithinimicrobium pekingense]